MDKLSLFITRMLPSFVINHPVANNDTVTTLNVVSLTLTVTSSFQLLIEVMLQLKVTSGGLL